MSCNIVFLLLKVIFMSVCLKKLVIFPTKLLTKLKQQIQHKKVQQIPDTNDDDDDNSNNNNNNKNKMGNIHK